MRVIEFHTRISAHDGALFAAPQVKVHPFDFVHDQDLTTLFFLFKGGRAVLIITQTKQALWLDDSMSNDTGSGRRS